MKTTNPIRARDGSDATTERGLDSKGAALPLVNFASACAFGTVPPLLPPDAITYLGSPSDPGIAMETPGASTRALLLPAASGPGRKRAAGEVRAATSKQRVLDEEEYIEVRSRCDGSEFWVSPPLCALLGSFLPGRGIRTLAEVEQPESVILGCGQ